MGKAKRAADNLLRAKDIAATLIAKKVFIGGNAERAREALVELGPTFVKFGQILSSRPDLIPEEYCEEFKKLRNNVKPMDFELVKEIIEESVGSKVGEIFEYLDPKPLGSASMAQVHKARLFSGETVVVKVQRRGIYEIMEKDINLMHDITKFIPGALTSGINLTAVIDEFWKTEQEEMDFLIEGRNLDTFYKNCKNIAYATCPKPYRDISTDKVLVMEAIEGIELDDHDELIRRGYDLNEIGAKIADHFIRQVVDDGFFHADPHQGNIMIREGKIVWLDLGMTGRLDKTSKSAINRAIMAVARNDIAALVDFVYTVGVYKERPDRLQLYESVSAFMSKYASSDLASIDLAKLFTELMDVLKLNKVEMPPHFTMLVRGLATVEGVVAELAPEIQIVNIAAARMRSRYLTPTGIKNQILKHSTRLADSVTKAIEIPGLLTDILKNYSRNETRIKLDLSPSDSLGKILFGIVQNVAFALIAAALFIASSILCTTELRPRVAGMPVLSLIGFILGAAIVVILILQVIYYFRHTYKG